MKISTLTMPIFALFVAVMFTPAFADDKKEDLIDLSQSLKDRIKDLQIKDETELAIIDLQDRTLEIEDKLSILDGRLTTLEQQTTATSDAINTLSMHVSFLQGAVASNSLDISTLQNQIATLQYQADTNTSKGIANMMAIMDLEMLIADLEEGLSQAESRLETAIGENTALIAWLQLRLAHAEQDIALKQDRISGVCQPGFAIRQINVDGTVVCERDNDSSNIFQLSLNAVAPGLEIGGIRIPIASTYLIDCSTESGEGTYVDAVAIEGYLSEGNLTNQMGTTFVESKFFSHRWEVKLVNSTGADDEVLLTAICARLDPPVPYFEFQY